MLKKVEGRTFRNETIVLDGNHYDRCGFVDCVIHTDTGNFSLTNNDFSKCRLSLGGHAANVAKLIKIFYPDVFWFEGEQE